MSRARFGFGIVAAMGLVAIGARVRADEARAPWTVPVLVIRYFPVTADGKRIDKVVTNNTDAPLDDVRRKCDRMTRETAESLQEGSRYHAYKDASAPASLKYEIVGTREYLEPLPPNPRKKGKPDYMKVLLRENIRDWVEKKGVKEVWIWAYHSRMLAPWESNMASPFGDISNSDRDPKDLPILSKTYTVYHYNYERETSEAVHNHMHQIEAIMRDVGGELWQTFEGKPGAWRCGNCHFPPNGRKDYDWSNKEPVQSDIEDWRPEGFGAMQPINCDKWNGDSLQWFVYWMRSIPGENNGLTWKGRKLRNWWVFLGDYDDAKKRHLALTD